MSCFFTLVVSASVTCLLTARPGIADTSWATFAPKGDGFSIEAPGAPQADGKPGHYVFTAGDWSFIIQVDPVSDTVRELVQAQARAPLAQYLETIGNGLITGGKATRRASSSADVEGYPALEISLDGQAEGRRFRVSTSWS
jgi:hypothetical protein